MSSTSRSLLATMICLALYGPSAVASDKATCADTEQPTGSSSDELAAIKGTCIPPEKQIKNPNDQPVTITADQAEAKNEDQLTYTGDILIRQANRTVAADQATYTPSENTVVAEGNVYFHDGTIEIYADKVTSNLETEDSEMRNAVYDMTCEAGRGRAERVIKDGLAYYRLKDGTYTTCPVGDNSWQFSASTIERATDSPFADLYNAKFEILNVPVMYLPYLRVPVTDERLTGFLYPSVSYGSRDGFELETPFYWNIAPNYDMTITPKYMTNRGLQLNSEFRYLTDFGQGSLKGEYLGDDKDQASGNDSHWGYNWTHNGYYQENWKFSIDYSRVSSVTYFSDVDSDIGEREDNNLLQTAEVSYRDTNWDTTLRVRDFQPLTSGVSSNYRLMPQVEANYYRPDLGYGLDFTMLSHVSRFENDDADMPSADRLHLEPTLTLPYSTPWWSITTEAKLMYSYYNQEFDDSSTDEDIVDLEETASRTVPSIRLHSGLYFERDTAICGSRLLV